MKKLLKLAGLMVFIAITSAVALAQTPVPTTIGVLNIAGPRRTVARNIIALLEADSSADPHFTVDIAKQTATETTPKDAANQLSERLLPTLVK